MARSVELNEATIAAHEDLARRRVPIGEACKQLGMSTKTYYAWSGTGEFSEVGSPAREFYERVVLRRQVGGVTYEDVRARFGSAA